MRNGAEFTVMRNETNNPLISAVREAVKIQNFERLSCRAASTLRSPWIVCLLWIVAACGNDTHPSYTDTETQLTDGTDSIIAESADSGSATDGRSDTTITGTNFDSGDDTGTTQGDTSGTDTEGSTGASNIQSDSGDASTDLDTDTSIVSSTDSLDSDTIAPNDNDTSGDTGAPTDSDTSAEINEPTRQEIIAAMTLANSYFMNKWPDPGLDIVTDKTRPSNLWTRAVYYEGLMGLYRISPQPDFLTYARNWAESHDWNVTYGNLWTRSADDQCCGQTYIELFELSPRSASIDHIVNCIDNVVSSDAVDDWWWIDAIQMAMPIYARLGVLKSDDAYFDKMYQLYAHSRNIEGGGLFNEVDGLWWRDASFVPPHTTPNGEDEYWSRGNGWVYAALTRVLEVLPADETHRDEYIADFLAMSSALRMIRRSDGFWNASLHDPDDFGGKELTGTALFVYGMAYGVRTGLLDETVYRPIVIASWNALVNDCLHDDGFLGYVQGTGKQPSDRQPVTWDSVPDFEDFGLGCFLLAGSETARLLQ